MQEAEPKLQITCGSITQGNGPAETDHVAGHKAMTGDSIA